MYGIRNLNAWLKAEHIRDVIALRLQTDIILVIVLRCVPVQRIQLFGSYPCCLGQLSCKNGSVLLAGLQVFDPMGQQPWLAGQDLEIFHGVSLLCCMKCISQSPLIFHNPLQNWRLDCKSNWFAMKQAPTQLKGYLYQRRSTFLAGMPYLLFPSLAWSATLPCASCLIHFSTVCFLPYLSLWYLSPLRMLVP